MTQSLAATKNIVNFSKNAKSYAASSNEMRKLPDDFQPCPLDVICKRGKTAYEHNAPFRATLREYLNEYSNASSKLEKSLIVSQIVEKIRNESPDGGFVREEKGIYYEVGDSIARERVGSQLRDMLHTKYRSSTLAKRKRRKEQENASDSEESSKQDEMSVSESPSVVTDITPLPLSKRRKIIDFSGTDEILADEIISDSLFGSLLQDISSRRQELSYPEAQVLEPIIPTLPPPSKFPCKPSTDRENLLRDSIKSFCDFSNFSDLDFELFRFSSDESALVSVQ